MFSRMVFASEEINSFPRIKFLPTCPKFAKIANISLAKYLRIKYLLKFVEKFLLVGKITL